jgi:multicomponent Na+:H+ antiporter subunit E
LRIIIFFLFYLLVWFVLTDSFSLYSFSFGLISSAGILFITNRIFKHHKSPSILDSLHPKAKIFVYFPWLVKEIINSAISVSRKIWGIETCNPDFKLIDSPLSKGQNFIYANSITLTPGTVAVDLGENTILVHALDKDDLIFMENGEMERKISKLC